MPITTASTSHRPAPARVLPLLAALLALTALLPAAADEAAPLPAAQAEALLADAAKGEIFALEAALPRIADPQLAALARARVAAARLQEDAALAALEPFLADDDGDPQHRRMAWSIAADVRFTAGDYAGTAHAAGAWHALLAEHGDPDGDADDAARFQDIAAQLAAVPAQAVLAFEPRTAAIHHDKVGLPRATMTVGGIEQEAVLDTGANLSVVSSSTAHRLGLRLLDGETHVGSGSRDAVASRLGVARRLQFAGATLSDVVFLVLDDADLEMPVAGGYRIDAILGFPVLRALQRIRFDADGLTPEAIPAAVAAAGNLRAVGNDLYVDTAMHGLPVSLQLDSGAARTWLSTRFAQRRPEVLRGLVRSEQRMAGAGGATTQRTAQWAEVPIDIAGRRTVLPAVAIAVSDSADVDARNAGLLGGDVLGAFDAWTLDFVRMRLELGQPVAETAPTD